MIVVLGMMSNSEGYTIRLRNNRPLDSSESSKLSAYQLTLSKETMRRAKIVAENGRRRFTDVLCLKQKLDEGEEMCAAATIGGCIYFAHTTK